MAGADINKALSVSKARVTPLMLAASQGYLECCMKIVEVYTLFCVHIGYFKLNQYTLST